ncbi:MAG: hypothetical protein HOP28_00855 [Gemmatimonadales bacterium]|nr:hypothetical protein [Gemmatimonadales bacterium]
MRRPKYGLLFALAAFAACSSGGDDGGTDPVGTIALSLLPTSASIPQGGSSTVAATLTRAGGFTGTVNLTVEGAPAGASATVGAVATTGSATTATVTIQIGATTTPGTYNLTVRGTATGLTDATAPFTLMVPAAGSFALAIAPAGAVTMQVGQTDNSKTVNITRTGYTQAITLVAENLPAGLTAVFTPNPATGNSATLALTASNVVPNTYTITIRGTGPAALKTEEALESLDATTTLQVTVNAAVTGGFTIATNPAPSVNVVRGNSVDATILVNRTGGFAGNVAFSVTGTVPGLTVNLNPTNTNGNTATLTVTTTAGLAAGPYPLVIRATSAGLADQTANLTVNVSAVGGGGNATLNWSACSALQKPVFVAFVDGTGTNWTKVNGVGDVYTFSITQGKGGYAYVIVGGSGNPTITVAHLTQAELTSGASNFCGTAPSGETVNGTVTNLPVGFTGSINFGGRNTVVATNSAFQFTNVKDASFALVGYARSPLGIGSGDRAFLDRPLNPANNGSVGAVDFSHSTKSFNPALGSITLNGFSAGEATSQGMIFYTGTGAEVCTPANLYGVQVTASPFNAYAIPVDRHVAGDVHQLTIIASSGTTTTRILTEHFGDIVTRAASPFVMPQALPIPALSDAGGAYKRPSGTITGVPAEFDVFFAMTYVGQTVARAGSLTASRGWAVGNNVTLTFPDFSALAGWNNVWALAPGAAAQVTMAATGGNFAGGCTAGVRLVTSSYTGVI